MGTVIRPEIAKSNRYWISRHRYYELKHFCMQYPYWEHEYRLLDGIGERREPNGSASSATSRPTEIAAEKRLYFSKQMALVEKIAKSTDPVIGQFIFKAVTTGMSYPYLRTCMNIPCCKDTYYELYRKFFWMLSNARG